MHWFILLKPNIYFSQMCQAMNGCITPSPNTCTSSCFWPICLTQRQPTLLVSSGVRTLSLTAFDVFTQNLQSRSSPSFPGRQTGFFWYSSSTAFPERPTAINLHRMLQSFVLGEYPIRWRLLIYGLIYNVVSCTITVLRLGHLLLFGPCSQVVLHLDV